MSNMLRKSWDHILDVFLHSEKVTIYFTVSSHIHENRRNIPAYIASPFMDSMLMLFNTLFNANFVITWSSHLFSWKIFRLKDGWLKNDKIDIKQEIK